MTDDRRTPMSETTPARITVRKSRDGHRCPWAATYPCCPFMNSSTGHGWPSWKGAIGQVERHLRDLHPRADLARRRETDTREIETTGDDDE